MIASAAVGTVPFRTKPRPLIPGPRLDGYGGKASEVMPHLVLVKRKYPVLAFAIALAVVASNAMAGEKTNNLTIPAVPRVTPRLEQPAPTEFESKIAHRELMRRLREAIDQLREKDPDAQGCVEG